MRIISTTELKPGEFKGAVVTVGNFDGVHLGHRALIEMVCERALKLGGPSMVYTFDPHPLRVLNPSACPPQLTDFKDKAALIAKAGAEVVVRARFDHEYAGHPPEWFSKEVLAGAIGAREVWIGADFTFGRGRKGNIDTLKRDGALVGYEAHSLPEVLLEGERVSSTRVRETIEAKDFAGAARLLGRPYSLHGMIVHGHRRGHGLGFPTANLLALEECIPPCGVYAGWATVDGHRREAAINVGPNPTFDMEKIAIEAHLIDFSGDLYEHKMRLEFTEHVRDEIAFASPDALAAQIGRDVEAVRGILKSGGAG